MPIKFCSEPIFFRLEVINKHEISESGPPSLKSLPEDFCSGFLRPEKNPSTSAGFEPAHLGSQGEHVTPRSPRSTVFFLVIE